MIEKIILASSSPRRKEILSNLGLSFTVISPDADEKIEGERTPCEYVSELALRKCESVRGKLIKNGENLEKTLIVACDTVVFYDNMIIGKPLDDSHAILTLGVLSDSWHSVWSGLALCRGGKICCDADMTRVKFRELTEETIKRYVETGEPMGKAGSYAAQGRGSALVERIDGDFFNVMGLPVTLMCNMLEKDFGVSVFELAENLK